MLSPDSRFICNRIKVELNDVPRVRAMSLDPYHEGRELLLLELRRGRCPAELAHELLLLGLEVLQGLCRIGLAPGSDAAALARAERVNNNINNFVVAQEKRGNCVSFYFPFRSKILLVLQKLLTRLWNKK